MLKIDLRNEGKFIKTQYPRKLFQKKKPDYVHNLTKYDIILLTIFSEKSEHRKFSANPKFKNLSSGLNSDFQILMKARNYHLYNGYKNIILRFFLSQCNFEFFQSE